MIKISGVHIWAKGTKISPETWFFAIFSSLVHQFPLKLHTMIACNNVYHIIEVKPMKKYFWAQIWAKISPKTCFFCHFLKFGLSVSLEIAYNDSLQQCLTYNRSKTHEKKFWGPNLGQRERNQSRNLFFCHFLKLGSLVFLEIACNESLQQCITYLRGKMYEKKLGTQIWAERAKIGLETRFFALFSSLAC